MGLALVALMRAVRVARPSALKVGALTELPLLANVGEEGRGDLFCCSKAEMRADRVARVSGLSVDEVLGVLVHATGSAAEEDG